MTIKIPLVDLLNVLPFKGRDDTRWALNGVLAHPHRDGALLTCTNGHTIGYLYSQGAQVDGRCVLDIDDKFARAIRDLMKPEQGHLYLENDHLVVKSVAGIEWLIKPGEPFIASTYPDVTKIIPKVEDLEPGLTAPVSSVYLSEIRRRYAENGNARAVTFWHRKEKPEESAVVARFADLPELVVMIMPIRGQRIDDPLPEWMPTSGL